MQLFACAYHKQSSHTVLTKARAQVWRTKIAQNIMPNVTISNSQTKIAIAEVDSCPLLTAEVAPARTRGVIYPFSLFLSRALLLRRCRLAHGLFRHGGSRFVSKRLHDKKLNVQTNFEV